MQVDITTTRLLEAVTWEWQSADDLMELLIPTVAPGFALRKYKSIARKNKGNSGKTPLTEQEQIRSGARQIVNDRIGSQVNGGRLERQVVDGQRQVRFRERRVASTKPGACGLCGQDFPHATPERRPQPSSPPPPRTKVVYPQFPQWNKQVGREGSSG